jgi:hypothetical protein
MLPGQRGWRSEVFRRRSCATEPPSTEPHRAAEYPAGTQAGPAPLLGGFGAASGCRSQTGNQRGWGRVGLHFVAFLGANFLLIGSDTRSGIGSNVLDGPLHALAHLTYVLADQPEFPALGAGEIVTTGTIIDAVPIAPGER